MIMPVSEQHPLRSESRLVSYFERRYACEHKLKQTFAIDLASGPGAVGL